jgi:hypothetical protein
MPTVLDYVGPTYPQTPVFVLPQVDVLRESPMVENGQGNMKNVIKNRLVFAKERVALVLIAETPTRFARPIANVMIRLLVRMQNYASKSPVARHD